MRSPVFRFLIIFLVTLTIIDIYLYWSLFRAFKTLSLDQIFYFLLTAGSIVWIFIVISIFRFVILFRKNGGPELFQHINIYTGIILFVYCPKIIFLPFSILADFILALNALSGISSRLLVYSAGLLVRGGLIIAPVASLLILYGIIYGRFNFSIKKYHKIFKDLPDGFAGVKIIHFSDLHTGSLNGHQDRFARIVRKVNELKPDLIFFTGDMVNNFAEELDGWKDLWGELKARLGKFAVLGNHDYGEYFKWKDKQQWRSNIDRLIEYIESMGFRLLMNESVKLNLDGQHIDIIGVENWGLPPFSQYGDLQKAMKKAERDDFKILLSHDPSHWEVQVFGHTNIQLTLSGHTHGMQFGLRMGNIRWSPIRLRYPRWGGWYQEGDQSLHVSTGLGYIAVPFRFGIRPEVVLIQLDNK